MTDANPPGHGGPGIGDDAGDGTEVAADIDAEFAALLADQSLWVDPPAGLADRVVNAVRSEAVLGAPDPAVAVHAPALGGRLARWRPALLGAAAAVVLVFGGIVVLSGLSGVEEVDTFSTELISTGLIPDVRGDVEISSFQSGLRIELAASGLPRRDDGAFYEGWMRTIDGNLVPIGTFHDGADVTLWAGVEMDQIEMISITLETAVGPDDPAQRSSGEVVLRAAFER